MQEVCADSCFVMNLMIARSGIGQNIVNVMICHAFFIFSPQCWVISREHNQLLQELQYHGKQLDTMETKKADRKDYTFMEQKFNSKLEAAEGNQAGINILTLRMNKLSKLSTASKIAIDKVGRAHARSMPTRRQRKQNLAWH